jgi:hypothetical protein
MGWFAELVDNVGTTFNLPEMGWSERYNGAKPTKNTGRIQYNGGPMMDLGNGEKVIDPNYAPFQQALALKNAPATGTQKAAGGGDSPQLVGGEDGGVYIPGVGMSYDPAAIAAAQKAAKDNARKAQLKGEASMNLDQLYALYDELTNEIKRVGGDQTNRINKDFDGKIQAQEEDMKAGMFDTDAAAAAGNLSDSSWRSFDRTKVRTAADANKKTLNSAREGSLAEVGRMVAGDTAKYQADKAGIERTRSMLNESDNLDEITTTATPLDQTKRGAIADKAKYATDGEFAQKASKVGQYDTTVLEQTLQSVISNATASPATKQAAMKDLLDGTGLEDGEKERLKNKYSQSI